MPAYVIADVEVTDPATFEEYRTRVGATVEQYGGRFIVRGGRTETLEGDYQPHRVVVLEFPSYEQARRWYHSSEYAPLITMRQKAANTTAILVEGA